MECDKLTPCSGPRAFPTKMEPFLWNYRSLPCPTPPKNLSSLSCFCLVFYHITRNKLVPIFTPQCHRILVPRPLQVPNCESAQDPHKSSVAMCVTNVHPSLYVKSPIELGDFACLTQCRCYTTHFTALFTEKGV